MRTVSQTNRKLKLLVHCPLSIIIFKTIPSKNVTSWFGYEEGSQRYFSSWNKSNFYQRSYYFKVHTLNKIMDLRIKWHIFYCSEIIRSHKIRYFIYPRYMVCEQKRANRGWPFLKLMTFFHQTGKKDNDCSDCVQHKSVAYIVMPWGLIEIAFHSEENLLNLIILLSRNYWSIIKPFWAEKYNCKYTLKTFNKTANTANYLTS